jgi:sensitive to high expression protein 9, mitochondrial
MQAAPVRLSQTIWSAFRASKPISRPLQQGPLQYLRPQPWLPRGQTVTRHVRFYSDSKGDIDRKAEEAKARLSDSLDARAEAVSNPDTLKPAHEETIIHTNPEASSIVHPPSNHEHTAPQSHPNRPPNTGPLPSQNPSSIHTRFASFMDNLQTHIFTASRRLNDLTGYSGIENLKNAIAEQENLVSSSRRAVKDARANYASAIATRSTTQREVNDLLHRKHNWSPADLERFTSLYRSDHANEQSETRAQQAVQEAEAAYEEASTTLARTILARYHEEQIWSDKIRQMSTWGTWGLMGLNVLLFVVFQVMIEPWRRRRLVRGFEEKVEVALRERDEELSKALIYGAGGREAGTVSPNAEAAVAGDKVDGIADRIVEQIVDAVSGSTAAEAGSVQDASTPEFTVTDAPDPPSVAAEFPTTNSAFASYQEAFQDLFSERKLVVTRKEMTNVALEGAVGGAAVMGLLLVLLRPR